MPSVEDIDDPEYILCTREVKLHASTITRYCIMELPSYTAVVNRILHYPMTSTGHAYNNSFALQNPVMQGVNIDVRLQPNQFSWSLVFIGTKFKLFNASINVTVDQPQSNCIISLSLLRYSSQLDVQSSMCVLHVQQKAVSDKFALVAQQMENYTLFMNSVLGVFVASSIQQSASVVSVSAISDSQLTLKLIQVFVKCSNGSKLRLFDSGIEAVTITAVAVSSCGSIDGVNDVQVVKSNSLCHESPSTN